MTSPTYPRETIPLPVTRPAAAAATQGKVTHLGALIEAYKDRQKVRPTDSAIARAAGVTHTSIGHWKRGKVLPSPAHLAALAGALGVQYEVVLTAALTDAKYLPRPLGAPGPVDGAPVTVGVSLVPHQRAAAE